jgi:NAD(P)H dehydrogenase (quinone)
VAELAPPQAIASNPAWQAHYDAVQDTVPEATLDDLVAADGFAFGTPTRFGNPSGQLKQFLDQTGGLWFEGKLADKTVTSFTSAVNAHGGQESTILALNNVFYHWGCVLVPPGYTDDSIFAAGGNPYGIGWPAGMDGKRPDDASLAAARHQGKRLAEKTALLNP